jgi:hypothetical protein
MWTLTPKFWNGSKKRFRWCEVLNNFLLIKTFLVFQQKTPKHLLKHNETSQECLQPWLIVKSCFDIFSDLRQVGGFLKVLTTLVSSTNKTDHHNITEILLKVAINTITITQMNSLERNLILHLNHCQPRKINWFSCFRLFVLFPWQQQPF